MKKIAQNAADTFDLLGWLLLEAFNRGSDDYNYMFVNIYEDFDSATTPKAPWWIDSKKVLGLKASILLDI